MKKYSKAQMIAKNLPTGSYAAGCPAHTRAFPNKTKIPNGSGYNWGTCASCEVAA